MGNQTRPRTDGYGWSGRASGPMGFRMMDGRCGETQTPRGPPATIDEALRKHCQIPGRGYIVVAFDQDFESQIYVSSKNFSDLERFVDTKGLKEYLSKLQGNNHLPDMASAAGLSTLPGNTIPSPYVPDLPKRPAEYGTYHQPHLTGFEPDVFSKGRKRLRHSPAPFEDPPMPETPSATTTPKGRRIRIESSKEIWEFYEQQFKNCQQTACKLIAKAWVKAVEPKKQSTHPYTGSDEKAPDWWPKPWGNSKDERVRHKEPDHLYKRERVHLLCHILRLVVEPVESQHPAIQKVNLNVKKLDEITMEALSTFFTDKENPNNVKKRPYLKDIFKVARQEERFKRGECDPSLWVHVRPDDRANCAEEDQNDEEEPRDFFMGNEPTKTHGAPQIMVSHEQGLTSHNIGRSSFSEPSFLGAQRFQQNGLVDGAGVASSVLQAHESLALQDDMMYPGSQNTTRRNSAYQTTNADFTNPATPVTTWYTTASNPASMYTMHTPGAPGNLHGQPSVNMGPELLGMEDFSRNFGHQPVHGEGLHDTTLGNMTMAHQTTYPNYSSHHAPAMGGGVKMEAHHPSLNQYTGGR